MKRTYEQLCPLAHTLDTVGDRWTLLIIRELLLGEWRYGDLLDALPGVGTNLLAERLRRLERDGLLERRDGRYALTDRGRGLKPAVLALAQWGLPMLAQAGSRDYWFRPSWLILSLQSMFRAERAAGVHETWEYRVGDDIFWLRVDDGSIDGGEGPADAPDLVVSTDADTFRAIGTGLLDPSDAAAAGRIAVTGDQKRFIRSLELVPPPAG
jgi:DNA-binding HxlR family transcriptional regulator